MMTVIAVIHVIVCLLLIALVLLQDPKSSGGGMFGGGGGSNSLLGATGAVTFLTRLTRYSAIIFGVTCIILTLLSRANTGSVIDSGMPVSQPPIQQPGTASAPTTGSAPSGANAAAPTTGNSPSAAQQGTVPNTVPSTAPAAAAPSAPAKK